MGDQRKRARAFALARSYPVELPESNRAHKSS
jgi:hypothetical protein